MPKHRAVIVGAGRIGAGWNWNDDGYTHVGAYLALKDRVELVGFVERDTARGEAAFKKWGVPWATTLNYFDDFDIVSVCTQPEQQKEVMASLPKNVKGAWVEKPWVSGEWTKFPVQVNYQRRADYVHRALAAAHGLNKRLVVYGKPDETTMCHFRDLSRFWKVPLDYRPFHGPCAYVLETESQPLWFDNGGVDSAECFKAMCGNLLDHIDNGTELWSAPYVE